VVLPAASASGTFRLRGLSMSAGLRRARLTFRYLVLLVAAVAVAGCGSSSSSSSSGGAADPGGSSSSTPIVAVGAENEYANVISQIGGKYVKASAIMSNPNTDPHTFEASPSVAQTVSQAKLIVQNGVGYDDFMSKIESASPSSSRKVIDVQTIRGLPDSTPNPHLWYDPKAMPAVARALVADLSALEPSHASYFQANERKFDQSLQPWLTQLKQFGSRYPGTAVATTEPVADYMLQAAGIQNLTPFSMQADIMNGTDPAPQSVALQDGLFSGHKVKVFLYNEQVTDTITQNFLKAAHAAGVPVVGVYETMPTPGYDYQSWMMAEIKAIENAVTEKVSTEKLG
jgi:zinc/manganese transport system substrate-binding protein